MPEDLHGDTLPARMPPADWTALFNAVAQRLHHLAELNDLTGDAAASLPGFDRASPLRECVAALQQLRQQLEPGLQGHDRLQEELSTAQTQLLRTQAELVQTRIDRRQAQHLALHDPLTQLPNRSHFQARLDSSLAGSEGSVPALAVLYLDLDGFKRINDEHGHATGDATLCIVARRLSRALRAQDTVCRLGGDEFACLLVSPAGREQLSQLACKLFDAVAAPLRVGALTLNVQPSIGIALYPGDGDSGSALLKRADAAMFRAKRRQQGYAFFEARSDL
ncbi:MAG: diguanylate cyclase [Rubrivivax sp.]|nr:diguanylate cyclase [Rubrivivax sp.]